MISVKAETYVSVKYGRASMYDELHHRCPFVCVCEWVVVVQSVESETLESWSRILGNRAPRSSEIFEKRSKKKKKKKKVFGGFVDITILLLTTTVLARMPNMSAITDSHFDPAPASASAGAEPTVPITLHTSLSQFSIPSGPYMVPLAWRRTHLSTLVNKLVSSTSEATGSVPFDFIIDASLLRTTLGEYLESAGLTSESTLSIEYVRSTLPPTRLAAFEHDDWVSSVDCSKRGVYLTSSYDGSVRIFTPSNAAEAEYTFSTVNRATASSGRSTSLTAAKWTENQDAVIVGGLDGRVQMYTLNEAEDGGWRSGRKWQGEAHNGPVSALDVAQGPEGVSVVSVGWDGVVALWDDLPSSSTSTSVGQEEQDSLSDTDDRGNAKKRKTADGVGASSSIKSSSTPSAGKLVPTTTFFHSTPASHSVTAAKNVLHPNSRISSVLFERAFSADPRSKNSNRAWTAGFNGQLKGFDLATGGTLHTTLSLPSSTSETRPILSLTQLTPTTLAVGSTDRAIHIFDVRAGEKETLGLAIREAHCGGVDVVRGDGVSGHLFASGSGAEGVVKVWDTRSSKKALFSLGVESKGEKGVLALDWTLQADQLVAGGKDKRITVYRTQS